MPIVEHNVTGTRKDVILAYKPLTKVRTPYTFVCAFVLRSVIFLDDETSNPIEHSCKDTTKCNFVRIQPNINYPQKLFLVLDGLCFCLA
jgi:hypothetical protein